MADGILCFVTPDPLYRKSGSQELKSFILNDDDDADTHQFQNLFPEVGFYAGGHTIPLYDGCNDDNNAFRNNWIGKKLTPTYRLMKSIVFLNCIS